MIRKEFNEKEFRKFYEKHAKKWNLDLNPDDPKHHYDYRKAYSAGYVPDQEGHWPSQFKHTTHPNRYVDGKDTITGKTTNKKLNERRSYKGY